MTPENLKLNEIKLEAAKKALEKKGFEVMVAGSGKEAVEMLLKLIGTESVIGFGGSRTLEQIGFHEAFTTEKFPKLLDRNNPANTPEIQKEIQKKTLTADYFLCSANSISVSGQLVLIDYNGNRNAAATYGPEKRIFVAGWNKICSSDEEGLDRASNTASVLNNIRFSRKNPCTKTGYCSDCSSEDRLCTVKTVITGCRPSGSAAVLLIREDLGF